MSANNKNHVKDTRTDDQIIEDIINSMENFNIGDIKKISAQGLMIAAFMLSGCCIDQLSNYRYYKQITGRSENFKRFKKFVDEYFPPLYQNKGGDLYSWVRCSLVHNYSTQGNFSLAKGVQEGHYRIAINNAEVLDIDSFVSDLTSAWEKYKAELKTDPAIRNIALLHHKDYPILVLRS